MKLCMKKRHYHLPSTLTSTDDSWLSSINLTPLVETRMEYSDVKDQSASPDEFQENTGVLSNDSVNA